MSTNEAMANPIVDAVDEIGPTEESVQTVLFEEEVVEDAEEALENIEANDEADPTPLIIDIDTISNEMTAMGLRASYEVEVASETESVVVSDPIPKIVGADQPRPEDQVYGPMTLEESAQGKDEEYERKRKEERERKKEIARRTLIRNKRISLHCHEQYFMTPNDLMIISREDGKSNSKPYFIKTDTQRSGKIMDLSIPEILSNTVMFDKNMNPLTVNFSSYRGEKSDKRCRRVDIRNTEFATYYNKTHQKKWIVVDKIALISSKGRNFKIRNRNGITIQEALELKRNIITYFDKGEAFINYVKSLMSQIYDEENFEIVYEFSFFEHSIENNFYLFFQFPNLTITNSIELTHNIDNLITRLFGKHAINSSKPNLMKFTTLMQGLRTKFSPEDLFYGYSHSHLSSYTTTWDTFCMGDEHFMTSVQYNRYGVIDELEFETLLVAMLDHISWESLEGGPYIKMESIGTSEGGIVNISNNRYLQAYQLSLLKQLMEYISEDVKFEKLFDAFTLKIEKGKEATYSFDKKLFITRFITELDQDVIYDLHEPNETSPYEYVPADDTFRRTDFEVTRANDWKELYKTARERIYNFPIVYMNGKYIKPSLTDIKAPIAPVKRSAPTIHPDVILYVAKVIYYHLLNELKNVKK